MKKKTPCKRAFITGEVKDEKGLGSKSKRPEPEEGFSYIIFQVKLRSKRGASQSGQNPRVGRTQGQAPLQVEGFGRNHWE